jgi:hypothetical protein
MTGQAAGRAVRADVPCFPVLFTAGFLIGAVRVTPVAPATGAPVAVATARALGQCLRGFSAILAAPSGRPGLAGQAVAVLLPPLGPKGSRA